MVSLSLFTMVFSTFAMVPPARTRQSIFACHGQYRGESARRGLGYRYIYNYIYIAQDIATIYLVDVYIYIIYTPLYSYRCKATIPIKL